MMEHIYFKGVAKKHSAMHQIKKEWIHVIREIVMILLNQK